MRNHKGIKKAPDWGLLEVVKVMFELQNSLAADML